MLFLESAGARVTAPCSPMSTILISCPFAPSICSSSPFLIRLPWSFAPEVVLLSVSYYQRLPILQRQATLWMGRSGQTNLVHIPPPLKNSQSPASQPTGNFIFQPCCSTSTWTWPYAHHVFVCPIVTLKCKFDLAHINSDRILSFCILARTADNHSKDLVIPHHHYELLVFW